MLPTSMGGEVYVISREADFRSSFYGAFSAKVLIVRTSGYPGWALPMAGGVLFPILMVLWLTSAFWLFGTHGVSL